MPDTVAGRAATEVARTYLTPALLNHSVRSYLWGAVHASSLGLDFDAELLHVAALLHDVGLVRTFDSHVTAFEETGGHLAWVFATGLGWAPRRRDRLREVIVAHMADAVDPGRDPEGYLLELGTSIDISGRSVDAVGTLTRRDVLRRHPRLGIGAEFAALALAQADRKPSSACARAVRGGLTMRAVSNPLDRPAA